MVLLKEDFNLDVELPIDRLVPTLPLRLNYILWIKDIVGSSSGIRGLDIGDHLLQFYQLCLFPLFVFILLKELELPVFTQFLAIKCSSGILLPLNRIRSILILHLKMLRQMA